MSILKIKIPSEKSRQAALRRDLIPGCGLHKRTWLPSAVSFISQVVKGNKRTCSAVAKSTEQIKINAKF
jgi:hypothetical protein